MPVLIADSSALVRAYLDDEIDHEMFRSLLLVERNVVLATQHSVVEVSRAFAAARRVRRMSGLTIERIGEEFQAAIGREKRFRLISLDPGPTLSRAVELVEQYPLGTLDAIHLAVADREGRALAGDDELVFVTADVAQGQAATALGMTVRP
ncbi:type II toxin-antitoxin system VapC family toxin [soil metagenome]